MNDLTDLLERTANDLRPDVPALVSGGIARGRKLRRRRRLGIAAGALTGVAAVGVAAVVVPSYVAGDSAPRDLPIATQPSLTAPTPTTAPALPSRADLAAGRVLTLPAGARTLIHSWGDDGFVAAAWRFVPASGGGAGRVEVLVETPSAKSEPATACQEDPVPCTRQADGSYLSTFTAPEPLPGGADSDIVGAHASLWTQNGLHLTATAYNAMGEKHTTPTRPAPVLDEAALAAIVRNANLG